MSAIIASENAQIVTVLTINKVPLSEAGNSILCHIVPSEQGDVNHRWAYAVDVLFCSFSNHSWDEGVGGGIEAKLL